MSFQQLNLIEPILKALSNEGYTTPTPIQERSIPVVLKKRDLLGCAQTGTGKTAAFAIPILQLLYNKKDQDRASKRIKTLVLTPTRELAIQIDESFGAYGKFTGLKHTVIFGGVSQHSQVEALRRGIDILTATPGRLLDLVAQGYVSLENIEIFVLDEADRMLDMGFIHDVKKILAILPHQKQTLFFSATMPPVIANLANSILRNPEKVEVTPVSSTADTIQQEVYFVEKADKRRLLLQVLDDQNIETVLVFTRTKHGANRVVQDLNKAGVTAEALHGNKSQTARQRALTNFKARTTRVLVATDIAARGIDVDDLTHVVNYEMPNVPETYVHRIGRTGRAGASGKAISFCDTEERAYLKDIQKLIGKMVPVVHGHPFENGTPAPESPQPQHYQRSNPAAPAQRRPQQPQQNRSQRPQPGAPQSRQEGSRPANGNAPVNPDRRNNKRRWFGKPKGNGNKATHPAG